MKQTGSRISKNNGFSLIELLIAIAIVGIIAVIAIPSYTRYVVKARQADAKTQLTAIRQSQEMYKLQNGTYTATAANLSGWKNTLGKYTFAVGSASSTAFSATATWTESSTTKDQWQINQDGTLTHPVNSFGVE